MLLVILGIDFKRFQFQSLRKRGYDLIFALRGVLERAGLFIDGKLFFYHVNVDGNIIVSKVRYALICIRHHLRHGTLTLLLPTLLLVFLCYQIKLLL